MSSSQRLCPSLHAPYFPSPLPRSALFPTMISCANLSPDDLVLKKMLYLYITHYATSVPDMALLAINQVRGWGGGYRGGGCFTALNIFPIHKPCPVSSPIMPNAAAQGLLRSGPNCARACTAQPLLTQGA